MHEKGDALNVVAFPEVIFRSGGGFSTKSAAVFGQATWEVLPSLELTGGLRYTYEKKKYDTLNNQQVIGVLIDPVNRIFLDFRGAPIPFVTGTTPDLTTNEVTPHLNIRSEEHTSELQSLMRISYSVFCLKKKKH